jgi:outer membrane protein assembly factor BamE (lipoprotein component of BamABCDE complex)
MFRAIPLFTSTQLVRPNYFRIFTLAFAAASLLIAASSINAQTSRRTATSASGEDEAVLFRDYRGIQLGMTADEVRKKLGDPKDKGDEQDFFVFNDTETAQIVYDKTHKVVTISADFMTVGDKVPTPKQIFGGDVEAKADGSVYRMLRLQKAGYWISYNRTGGASPLTTVTLQKIQ